MIKLLRLSALLSLTVMTGCTARYDAQLTYIDVTINDNPTQAIASLKAIDPDSLSAANRRFYDLLTIKAYDKAYVDHTSDSLILDVIDWFENHDKSRYAEALYYGGRVYSDLGDLPTALRYFHDALDELPGDRNIELRRNIVSQIGRLLENLSLPDQAIPYIEESLRLTERLGEENIYYDYRQLGDAYSRKKDYRNAEINYKRALSLSKEIPLEAAYSRGALADVKYRQGDLDSALLLIRGVPEAISYAHDRDYYKTCAANIYYSCGKYDSARILARAITASENLSYRIVGYKLLLTPELKNTMPRDSVDQLIDTFRQVLSKRYNEHSAQAVIAQNSFYNYSIHQRESQQLAESRARMLKIIILLLALCIAALLVIMRLSRVAAKRKQRLRSMLDTIRRLNERLEAPHAESRQTAAPSTPNIESTENSTDLRDSLLNEIARLKLLASKSENKTPNIAYTTINRQIQESINSGTAITDNYPILSSIKKKVNSLSPDFEATLRRLSGGKLTEQDLQLASLIRLGIPANQIAQLFGRTKGAITYRRKLLCRHVFDDQISVAELDDIIRCI